MIFIIVPFQGNVVSWCWRYRNSSVCP